MIKRIILLFLILCIFLSLTTDNETLNNTSTKNHYNQTLGRNNDPKIIMDLTKFQLWSRKRLWEFLTLPGLRFMTNLIYPKSTISHFNSTNTVAFTIDDGFCGLDNPNGSMLKEVLDLFKENNANATFFVTGSHCAYTTQNEIDILLNNGHELANHSMYDWPYNKYSKEEFKYDLNETKTHIHNFTNKISKWYRAPHAKLSKDMQSVIDAEGLTHIVCDAFASDTAIPDAKWIAEYILNRVKPGSIILIHMPERGIREWNYEAMKLTLEGLNKMDLNIVTLTELDSQQ